MTAPTLPEIECERLHPTLSVRDVPAAVDYCTSRLGFQLGFLWGDPPRFAGVTLGQVQLFLQLGTPSPAGCEVKFVVGDAVHRECLAQGLDVTWPPTDMPWNVREMHVRHPDGHVFRIRRGIPESD